MGAAFAMIQPLRCVCAGQSGEAEQGIVSAAGEVAEMQGNGLFFWT